MARFSIGGRASAVSTALRGTSLYSGGATNVPKIVEVHIYNTTPTAPAAGAGVEVVDLATDGLPTQPLLGGLRVRLAPLPSFL